MNASVSPSSKNSLTAAKFDGLLLRLDPDRDRAGEKYEEIRWKLIRFFQWGCCVNAEDLVDETFNRVAEKVASQKEEIHDLAAFVWGVAKNIRQEAFRNESKRILLSVLPELRELPATPVFVKAEADEARRRLKCLRKCLHLLSAEDRKLLLKYHSDSGRRGEGRQRLAEEKGITSLALRVRVNRLRFRLEQYIKECLAFNQTK